MVRASLFCCWFSVFHEYFFLNCFLLLLLAMTASRAARKGFRTARASGMYLLGMFTWNLTSNFLSLAFPTEENIFYLAHCGPFIVCHCCAFSVMGNISTGASLRRRLIREQLLEIKTPNWINLFGFEYGVTSYFYVFLVYMYVCLQTDLFLLIYLTCLSYLLEKLKLKASLFCAYNNLSFSSVYW